MEIETILRISIFTCNLIAALLALWMTSSKTITNTIRSGVWILFVLNAAAVLFNLWAGQ